MPAATTTHATLLARLANPSDRSAWGEFHDRYSELIRGFARRRGLQPADAEDVAQEVLLALTKAMPGFQYDPGKGKFRSYLKTATLRVIFSRNRKKPGPVCIEDIEQFTRTVGADDDVDQAWEAEWRQYHLRLAMRTIEIEFDKVDCEAFRRYAVNRQDARETAAALSMRVDRVYEAKSRIAKRLRELIKQQVQDEG